MDGTLNLRTLPAPRVVSDEANVVSSDVANKLKDDKEFMNAVDGLG